MTKRKTRSANINNDDGVNVCEIGLPSIKRHRGKKTCASKLLFDQNNVAQSPEGIKFLLLVFR
jgi:hypothetical protein